MTAGSSTTIRRCPLCRHDEPAQPVPPRLRDMTLGDAWGVLKDAAARSAMLGVTLGAVVGAIYLTRGTLRPFETPPTWVSFMLWAGISVAGYFSAADFAIGFGSWLVRT